MKGSNGEVLLVSGTSNIPMAEEIAATLGIELLKPADRFSDGETQIDLGKSIRGVDAFIIQSTCPPDTDHYIIEAGLIANALKGAHAGNITLVVPYFGYARQDKKKKSGEPRSARYIAKIIEASGVNQMLLFDLHSNQIQSFFDIPVDHIFARPVLLDYIKKTFIGPDYILVSPDAGGLERVESYSERTDIELASVHKKREIANQIKKMILNGLVKGKKAIVLDDIFDTFGTIEAVVDLLLDLGKAEEVHACGTHPVLSGPAISRINKSRIKSVTVTNTIPLSKEAQQCSKVQVVSVAGIIAEAIRRVNNNESVSSLFD